jgi:hypothetical protein
MASSADPTSGAVPTAAAGRSAAATPAHTATGLTVSPAAPVANRPLTLTVTVRSTTGAAVPSGTVTVKDGEKILGRVGIAHGQASFTISGLAAGTHHLTAVYTGTAADAGSTSAVRVVPVTPAATSAGRTTTTLAATPADPAAGQRVTLTATVRPASGAAVPAGTVTFKDGSKVLGSASLHGGKAVFTTAALAAGTHRFSADYAGAGSFHGSTAAPLTLTAASPAARAATRATLAVTSGRVPAGKAVTFAATIRPESGSGSPTGTVTFRDGGVIVGTVPLEHGSATLTLSALGAGSHSVTVTYNGDGRFAPSTSAAESVGITPTGTPATGTAPAACVIVVPPTAVSASKPVTLKAEVHPLSGSAVPTGRVTFRKGSLVLGSATLDGTGTATFTLPAGRFAAGQYYLSAYYEGDSRYAGDAGADLLVLTR